MVEKIYGKIKGTAPYLMNKFSIVQEDLKNKRTKKIYEPGAEAERKTYRNEDGNLCIPSLHIKTSMVKAATDFMLKGKKTYKDCIKGGIIFQDEFLDLKQPDYKIHEEPVVISRSRVMSWRPRFDTWEVEFIFNNIDEANLNISIMREILETAGKYKGIGDHRPEYGRFEVVELKKL